MKTALIITCFCIFTFAKCKKDNNEPEGQYFGYAKATANGELRIFNKVRGGLINNNPDSFFVGFEKWDGLVLKEATSFGPMLKVLNVTQRVYKYVYGTSNLSSTYSTLRDDGDVLCDLYKIYEPDSLQNFIIISSFNNQTKEIRGTFQATYLIDSVRVALIGKCRPTAPDTIKIRNGEFYTKIF